MNADASPEVRQAVAAGVSDKAVSEPILRGRLQPFVIARFMSALLLAATAATPLSAQTPDADPLSSSECVAAREELDKAISEPAGSRQARSERLARARQRAALVCLGRESARERAGAPQPPQAVPPPVVGVRPAQAAPAIATPQPPLAIPRAAAITTCDPAGCWDSEGRRLNNMGPLLMGPRGLCTIQGGLLNCP
jgi:hypothetical protein